MPTGSRRIDESGFLMVALLIGMAVAAVYMSAALPAWRQQAQREKEQDLLFRGRQYARAIVLFQEKNRGANPPDIDILVSQHFLRKKWKDPVTGEDFVPLGLGVATPGSGTQPGTSGGQSGGGQPLANQNPGVSGVRSKSTATSIKVYQNQQQYSLWPFNAASYRAETGRNLPQQPGQGGQNPRGGGPGAGGPGGGPGVGAPGTGPPRGGPGGPGGAAGSGPLPPAAPPGGRAGGSN